MTLILAILLGAGLFGLLYWAVNHGPQD